MRITILFLCLALGATIPSEVNAQDTLRSYFDQYWRETSKDKAVYYRKYFENENDQWTVLDFFKSGQLQMRGYYSEEALETKVGHFEYFYADGDLKSQNSYSNEGVLLSDTSYSEDGNISEKLFGNNDQDTLMAYHENGILSVVAEMKDGSQEGYTKYYYDNGEISSEGEYFDGLKTGEWKYYDSEGNYIASEYAILSYDLPCDFEINFPGNWIEWDRESDDAEAEGAADGDEDGEAEAEEEEEEDENDDFSVDVFLRKNTYDKKGNEIAFLCNAACYMNVEQAGITAEYVAATVMKRVKGKSKRIEKHQGQYIELNGGVLYTYTSKQGRKKMKGYFYTKKVENMILELFFEFDPKMDPAYIPVIFEIIGDVKYTK